MRKRTSTLQSKVGLTEIKGKNLKANRGKIHKIVLLSFLIINIILIFSAPIHSSEWNFVASTKNSYYFVDSESINIHDTEITFWIIRMDTETGKVKSKKRCTVDCCKSTFVVRDVIRYSSIGNILEAISYKDELDWYVILPESATQAIEHLLCSDGGPREDIRKYLKQLFSEKR